MKDIRPDGDAFAHDGGSYLTAIGDTLYFTADDGVSGVELWKSDGTENGTVPVRDINPGPADASPAFLRNVDGTLFFIADDGTHGLELWASDGSEAGTRMVSDINPAGSAFGTFSFFFSFADLGGMLFFAADDGMHGTELWHSDGTAPGTSLVADINPGDEGSSPAFLTSDGGRIVFQACEPTAGCELWETTGTDARREADIVPGPDSSNPGPFTPSAGRLFFAAEMPATGTELWELAACSGDCDGNGVVSIDELIRAVRIGLAATPIDDCRAADADSDGHVTIDELVRAVNAALGGCA